MIRSKFLAYRICIVISVALILLLLLRMSNYTLSPPFYSSPEFSMMFPQHQQSVKVFPGQVKPSLELVKGNVSGDMHPWYRPVPYTILPSNICNPTQKVLFIIQSAVTHFVKRDVVRETFGHKKWFEKFNVRTMFAVGKTYDEADEIALEREAMYHGDILQGDFHDGYRNLTMKDLMWMRYVRDYCPNLELVVLLCDDFIPNIFWIFEDFNNKKISTNETFTCLMFVGPIIRDPVSPWFAPIEAVPEPNWPQYCSGTGYMVSTDLFPAMIEKIKTYRHYISVDDAFVTGVIGHAVNATYDFNLYANKYSLNESITEEQMLNKQIVMGQYGPVKQLKRVFHELQYIYRMEVDSPDNFKEPIKNAYS